MKPRARQSFWQHTARCIAHADIAAMSRRKPPQEEVEWYTALNQATVTSNTPLCLSAGGLLHFPSLPTAPSHSHSCPSKLAVGQTLDAPES